MTLKDREARRLTLAKAHRAHAIAQEMAQRAHFHPLELARNAVREKTDALQASLLKVEHRMQVEFDRILDTDEGIVLHLEACKELRELLLKSEFSNPRRGEEIKAYIADGHGPAFNDGVRRLLRSKFAKHSAAYAADRQSAAAIHAEIFAANKTLDELPGILDAVEMEEYHIRHVVEAHARWHRRYDGLDLPIFTGLFEFPTPEPSRPESEPWYLDTVIEEILDRYLSPSEKFSKIPLCA